MVSSNWLDQGVDTDEKPRRNAAPLGTWSWPSRCGPEEPGHGQDGGGNSRRHHSVGGKSIARRPQGIDYSTSLRPSCRLDRTQGRHRGAPPLLRVEVRNRFLQTAFTIWLRPRPATARPTSPTGRSTMGRWMNGFGASPAAHQDPSDNRVRVPHFACVELVPAPHRCRYRGQSLEDSSGDLAIVGDPDRAPDGLIDVRNAALSPTPNLVAEDPESAEPAHSNWTLRHHTSSFAVQIGDGRLLDHDMTVGK